MKAHEICLSAAQVVDGERRETHGDIYEAHEKISLLWTAYLNGKLKQPIAVQEVSLMLALMKIARTQSGSINVDDYVDLAGYAGCAGEVATYEEKS